MSRSITKVMYTETGHRLMDYEGKCAHLHGHSYRWEVTVAGPVDDRGMIVDFSQLKEVLIETIGVWDHALLLHREDPLAKYTRKSGEFIPGEDREDAGIDLLEGLDGTAGRVFVYSWNPTAENMAKHMLQVVGEFLPSFAPVACFVSKIRLQETQDSFAEVYADKIWKGHDHNLGGTI